MAKFERMSGGKPHLHLSKQLKNSMVLVLLALFCIVVFILVTVRVQRVKGTEVGIKVNNISGSMAVISQPGTHIYNGLLTSFHVLDKTVQRLEMTATRGRGDRQGQDDLRVKTLDGSDVFLDLTINYKILMDRVENVIKRSGLGSAYKVKWVRDYSRSVCRNVFGELTTEEFYDASERNLKAVQAKETLNTELKDYGIEIISVIPEDFRFHEEYQEKIREKKLADQEVEEQISKANAALQNQKFREVEATKKKEVAITSYKGEMQKWIVGATADAEKLVKEAEAYAVETRKGADAQFYQKEKNAQAITVRKQAEAEGLEKMAKALEGDGGMNLVKMDYVTRLQHMRVSGQPYTVSGQTERFTHVEEGGASARRPGQ